MKSIVSIVLSALLLSACGSDSDRESPSSTTELEGKWGFPNEDLTLIFSGNEYDLNIPEIPEIPGIDFCSDFDDLIIEDPCSFEEITSSGTFVIGDSFINTRGETVTKIDFFQELLNGEPVSRKELATYRIDNGLLYLGDRSGELIDQPLFKK